VFNLDQLWEEVLYYPDTILTMGDGVGIDESDILQGLRLMQNVPNPFDGTTEFVLVLPEDNDVTLEIYDLSGKLTISRKFSALEAGSHLFRATLVSPQTYLLGAITRNGQTTIKMVNEGHGGENSITHVGMVNTKGDISVYLKEERGNAAYPFHVGDTMEYTGYTVLLDGSERVSNTVKKSQINNETIALMFNMTLPNLRTMDVINITSTSAICRSEILDNGGELISTRGICWNTSPNPSISNSHTTSNSGATGTTYSDIMTNLIPNCTYYVRAYATNLLGTNYGEERIFNTLCNDVNVTISGVTSINYGQSTTLYASGAPYYLWNTGVTQDHITVNPTTTTTYSVTGSDSYGCTGTASVTVTVVSNPPTVTTNNVTTFTATTATCGGNVTNNGGATITERGVCWSTSTNPTLNDSYKAYGSGAGSFSFNISGLADNTTYYVKAYATYSGGTVYGDLKTFTTSSFTCGNSTTDYDGNSYNTVQIGQQCWMKENLRTTHYADGTVISDGGSSGSWTIGHYYNYSSSSIVLSSRGYLYNWLAVMHGAESSSANPSGVQGICPDGWHVPSDAEWTQLEDYVGSQSQYCCSNSTNFIAKALASNSGWSTSSWTCAVGNDQTSNNATGFSAVPAGCFLSSFCYVGNCASFWSSTQYSSEAAYSRSLWYDVSQVNWNGESKSFGRSVRCLRDAPSVVIDSKSCSSSPTVTDHEGNVYATVQIGDQCWMRENLRTTTSPSTGTYLIPPASTSTYTGKQAQWYNNDSTTYAPMNHGLLYNWNAAADTFNTAYGETSVNDNSSNAVSVSFSSYRRGICPDGWHLPSDAEWTQLTDYVSGQGEYTCGGESSYIAKAMASMEGWSSSSNFCAVGNIQTSNNASGFSAVPAGLAGPDSYNSGFNALFWSSTQHSGHWASSMFFYSGGAIAELHSNFGKHQFHSVRCLRNDDSDINSDGQPCPGASTVSYDGVTYNTVQIGQQCWMKENLRNTHYADGTSIPSGGSNTSETMGYYYNYSSSSIPLAQRGYLYNWPAVMHGASSSSANPSGVQGICPDGWHVPSDAEWTTLTNYVKSQSQYVCGSDNTYIAKALASTEGWSTSSNNCAVGNDQSSNNVTGFTVVPAGYCNGSSFNYAGNDAYFWSSTQDGSNYAYYRSLGYSLARVYRGNYNKDYGRSVRCLRDAPSVVIDSKSCSSSPTVTDHEGNVYATVQIGDQCWMRENLRTTTSPSTGTYLIPAAGTGYTYTGKQARWYNNDSTTYAPMNYGLLYNWNAAVDTFNTAYGETSVNTSSGNGVSVSFSGHRRGICPAGWHVPSDAEWTQLTNYVGGQSEYICEGNSSYIAKALASTEGWNTSTYYSSCMVGNDQTLNNATGFSAVPAGYCDGSSFYNVGGQTFFWSSTQYSNGNPFCRILSSGTRGVNGNADDRGGGYSVRCLKN
jgi:uncharacterized protein (TIGR02145 family)